MCKYNSKQKYEQTLFPTASVRVCVEIIYLKLCSYEEHTVRLFILAVISYSSIF